MIKGHLVSVGTQNVDGEEIVGCFVQCTVDELRNNRADLYRDVEIRAAKISGAQPPQATNTASDVIPLWAVRTWLRRNMDSNLAYVETKIVEMVGIAEQHA